MSEVQIDLEDFAVDTDIATSDQYHGVIVLGSGDVIVRLHFDDGPALYAFKEAVVKLYDDVDKGVGYREDDE